MTYNGDDLSTGGVKVSNLVKMVDQEDRHMPLLTVRETLAYAERFQAAVRVTATKCLRRLHVVCV